MVANPEFDDLRRRLLCEIQDEAQHTRQLTGRAAFGANVMAALEQVPRHEFIAAGDRGQAYANRPQTIGYGQTISQPFIVAAMTDLLDLDKSDTVLEIGSGSGYQSAILACVTARVFSVEIIPQLASAAEVRLRRLGYDNVNIKIGDGRSGWPEEAPYDGIIVTAVTEEIPPALIGQLSAGGRMIVPVGTPDGVQTLVLGVKDLHGQFETDSIFPVSFVPLVRGD